jgi:hypothetical protein
VHRFAAPWDRTLRVLTGFALALVLGAGVVLGTLVWRDRGPADALVLGLLFATIPAVTWALAPSGFAVGGGRLRIERHAWRAVEIPLARVRTAGLLPRDAIGGAIRLFGTGGLFGYYGLFRSRALGRFRLYATRTSGHVAVRTDEALYVLTPDRPETFVETVLGAAPSAVRDSPPGR